MESFKLLVLVPKRGVWWRRGTVLGVVFRARWSGPDGATVATGDDFRGVTLWNAASGRQEPGMIAANDPNGVWALAFSPDRTTLALGDATGNVTLWSTATLAQLGTPLPAGTPMWSLGMLSPLASSPPWRSARTAPCWPPATAATWSASSTSPLALRQARRCCQCHPAGQRSPGRVLYARRQDAGHGRRRRHGPAMGPGNRKFTDVPLVSDSIQIDSAAFSRDGSTLALGYANGTVRLWDMRTDQQIGATLNTGTGSVDSLAFSPTGANLVTGGDNGVLEFWNVSYLANPLPQLCAVGPLRPDRMGIPSTQRPGLPAGVPLN